MRTFRELQRGNRVVVFEPTVGLVDYEVYEVSENLEDPEKLDIGVTIGPWGDRMTLYKIIPDSTVSSMNSEKSTPCILYSDVRAFEEDQGMILDILVKKLTSDEVPFDTKFKWSEVWEKMVPEQLKRIKDTCRTLDDILNSYIDGKII